MATALAVEMTHDIVARQIFGKGGKVCGDVPPRLGTIRTTTSPAIVVLRNPPQSPGLKSTAGTQQQIAS